MVAEHVLQENSSSAQLSSFDSGAPSCDTKKGELNVDHWKTIELTDHRSRRAINPKRLNSCHWHIWRQDLLQPGPFVGRSFRTQLGHDLTNSGGQTRGGDLDQANQDRRSCRSYAVRVNSGGDALLSTGPTSYFYFFKQHYLAEDYGREGREET